MACRGGNKTWSRVHGAGVTRLRTSPIVRAEREWVDPPAWEVVGGRPPPPTCHGTAQSKTPSVPKPKAPKENFDLKSSPEIREAVGVGPPSHEDGGGGG